MVEQSAAAAQKGEGATVAGRERKKWEGMWSFQVSFYSVQISLLEDKYLANT